MEESTKKSVMIGVIVVCLVAAAAITYRSISGGRGIGSVSGKETVWIKCINPDCNAAYEMSEREYYKQVQESESVPMQPIAIRCEKCGENSAYRAEKCPKCGLVFIRRMYPRELGDKCPGCGYSITADKGK